MEVSRCCKGSYGKDGVWCCQDNLVMETLWDSLVQLLLLHEKSNVFNTHLLLVQLLFSVP